MSAPSGYTALDFVGFTDKGTYNPLATYMRNDLVHYGGNIWKCLVDNTTGITPVEGANWTLWIGTSANLAERTIAPLLNNPADAAFGVGRQVIYDDWLWEVIAPIAIGDTLIDYAVDPTNANIKKSNPVETQLLAVKAEADATDNMIAPTEANASSSSAAYAVGDQLILNNILYTVTAPVTIGDALVSGTGGNIEASDNLTDQLDSKANSSDFATVATSGSYADLSNKPTLGTAAAKNSTNAVTQSSTDLVESGAVYSEVNTVKQALMNEAVTRSKVGAHNLLPISLTTQTEDGVTFTVNSGVISTIGSSSSGMWLILLRITSASDYARILTAGQKYILSGCPSGGGEPYRLVLDSNGTTIAADAGSDVEFTAPTFDTNFTLYLRVAPSTNMNGKTFKPMIRFATDPNTEFEPYVMTNRELTQNSPSKKDITNINIIGSTNDTGSTITRGTYFYLNGSIVRAITSIANGATLTYDTNYATVPTGVTNHLRTIVENRGLALGTERVLVSTLNSDLDNLNVGNYCWFDYSGSSGFAHLPNKGTTWAGVVYCISGYSLDIQLAFEYSGDGMFFRTNYNGTWAIWRKLSYT